MRGVVPEPHSLSLHSEIFRLGNHPSRHRKERDDAALLTQEGNSPVFTAPLIRVAFSFLGSCFRQPGNHLPMIDQPGLLNKDRSMLHHNEIWNAHDIKSLR